MTDSADTFRPIVHAPGIRGRLTRGSGDYLLTSAALRLMGFAVLTIYSRFLTPSEFGIVSIAERASLNRRWARFGKWPSVPVVGVAILTIHRHIARRILCESRWRGVGNGSPLRHKRHAWCVRPVQRDEYECSLPIMLKSSSGHVLRRNMHQPAIGNDVHVSFQTLQHRARVREPHPRVVSRRIGYAPADPSGLVIRSRSADTQTPNRQLRFDASTERP